MPKKNENKYRNVLIRKQNWNYAWDGSYFITICTKDRKHFFGEIQDGRMILLLGTMQNTTAL